MKKTIGLSGFLILSLILSAGDNDALKLRCISAPNLLRNADFRALDRDGLPQEWSFDNCSQSNEFRSRVVQHPDGSFLSVDTAWSQFGYWLQNVPVKEGVTYYVSCEVESDNPSIMAWLKCDSGKQPAPAAEFKFPLHLRNGAAMKAALKDFVDEELLNSLGPDQWSLLHREITIPADRGVTECAVRFGIYGGYAGQARFRKPVFREAWSVLEVEISGAGWTLLRVPGAQPATVELDPAREKQTVKINLSPSCRSCLVELSAQTGDHIIKEIANE